MSVCATLVKLALIYHVLSTAAKRSAVGLSVLDPGPGDNSGRYPFKLWTCYSPESGGVTADPSSEVWLGVRAGWAKLARGVLLGQAMQLAADMLP